jgi:hypothetical protein
MNDTLGDIPSRRKRLLRELVGARVTTLTRHLAHEIDEDEVRGRETGVFSLSYGPLWVATERGLTVSFGSDPALISVILGRQTTPLPRSHPIDARDERYVDPAIRALLGRRVDEVRVLRQDWEGKALSRPRQVGVVLRFEGGGELIPAHGLHNGSDDFVVLARREQIDEAIAPTLQELPLDEIDAVDRALLALVEAGQTRWPWLELQARLAAVELPWRDYSVWALLEQLTANGLIEQLGEPSVGDNAAANVRWRITPAGIDYLREGGQ